LNQKNYKMNRKDLIQFSIIAIVFMALFFGIGTWYYAPNEEPEVSASTEKIDVKEAIDQYKTQRYGEAVESECTWCGGIGKVGYAGQSELQVRRTGNGLGNSCTSCKGTGKIKTYPNEK
jgi:hypothetical protein